MKKILFVVVAAAMLGSPVFVSSAQAAGIKKHAGHKSAHAGHHKHGRHHKHK